MKTAELKGAALDYAVAKADGRNPTRCEHKGRVWFVLGEPSLSKPINYMPGYTTSPAGDDIIDRESISVIRCDDDWGTDADGFSTDERIPVWAATMGQHTVCSSTEHQQHNDMYQIDEDDVTYGATRREAAMRCFVLKRLGKSVDLPDELQ